MSAIPDEVWRAASTHPAPEGPVAGKPAFDVLEYLAAHGVEVKRTKRWASHPGGSIHELAHCIFDPDHTGGSAAVTVNSTGAIGYRCQHSGCQGRDWQAVREHFDGPREARKYRSVAATAKQTATQAEAPEQERLEASKQGGAMGRPAPRCEPEASPFRLTDSAVVYIDPDPDREPLTICGPLEVVAKTRNGGGEEWGALLRWRDGDGAEKTWAMPMSLLAGDGSEYRARLLAGGLLIAPGTKARNLLTTYLQTARTDARARCVSRVGWQGDVFVLPDATVGTPKEETVLFQAPFETDHYLKVAGTVEEWRDNVGRLCSENSRLILAVSCAFAGPVLHLVRAESGGIHFHGATSTGKSTALIVGGSVCGGGGSNGFVQSWRATANGLEAVAELHNDLTMFLDELAQVDPREAAEVAYLLGNGAGKLRMSRNTGARKKLSWSLLFVSAGEVTLADHAQTAGKRTRGGAEVRLLNIDADAGAGLGLFQDIHGAASPDLFARQLKESATRYYGAPLRAYLKSVTGRRAAVESALRGSQADFLKNRVPVGASGEVLRAAQRFALIAAAGELAACAGITGWEPGEATDAATRCFRSWIEGRGTTGAGDIEVAIDQVRQFIGAHGASRFQSAKARRDNQGDIIHERIIERAGFRVDGEDGEVSEYLILPEVFRHKVCEGFDYRAVARALLQRGHLDCEPPHLTKKPRLPELGAVRVYAVKSSILGE